MKKVNPDYIFIKLRTEGNSRCIAQRTVYGLISQHDFSLVRGIVRRGYEEIALLRAENKFELIKERLSDLNSRVVGRLKKAIIEVLYQQRGPSNGCSPVSVLKWEGEAVEVVEFIRLTSNMLVSTESFGV